MFQSDWLILRILHQSFEIEKKPQRSLVRGGGISLPSVFVTENKEAHFGI